MKKSAPFLPTSSSKPIVDQLELTSMLKNVTAGEVVTRATMRSNPLIHLKVSRHDMLYLSLSYVANHAHSSEGKGVSGSESNSEEEPGNEEEAIVDDKKSGEEVHEDVVEEEDDKRDDNNGERLIVIIITS